MNEEEKKTNIKKIIKLVLNITMVILFLALYQQYQRYENMMDNWIRTGSSLDYYFEYIAPIIADITQKERWIIGFIVLTILASNMKT